MSRSRAPEPAASPRARAAVRWLLAGCNAAMVLATWGVWQRRSAPPLLPRLPLPQASVGVARLLVVAWAAWRPRSGIPAHGAVLRCAVLADETRLQPYVVSLALLAWGASDALALRLLARVHLIARWFWSGVHKALSPAFGVATAADAAWRCGSEAESAVFKRAVVQWRRSAPRRRWPCARAAARRRSGGS